MNRILPLVPGALALAVLSLWAAPPPAPRALKPVNLTVNTKANEDDPHAASNGLALYYSSNVQGKWDIMVSRRRSTRQVWGTGQVLEDYVSTPGDDRSVFLTDDGRYPQFLYYATRKDKEGTNYDLYVAVRQDADKAFAEPTPLGAIDTEADELFPWITDDGQHLYFSRKRKEGWRVFVSSRPAGTSGAQGWGAPELVDELPPNFHHVTLTRNGKTMYLQGPLEKRRTGLFRATWTGRSWSKPEALAELNNPDGPTGDRSPNLNRDGTMLYFASDRPGGKGGLDLWVIPTNQLRVAR
jgi:hypothetical protein